MKTGGRNERDALSLKGTPTVKPNNALLIVHIMTGGNVMQNTLVYGLLLVVAAFAGGSALGQDTPPAAREAGAAEVQDDTYGEKLGTVQFPVSCNQAASQHAQRGLALLHHMTYEGARSAFAAATAADPDCAMGYWGQAMSLGYCPDVVE